MIRLNGVAFAWRPEMSLQDLVDDGLIADLNVGIEGFVVIVDGKALTTAQARMKTLCDNESVYIVPVLDGG